MKKIIATVLAMVMALALCTTAFAAPSTTTYKTTAPDGSNGADVKIESIDGVYKKTYHSMTGNTANIADGYAVYDASNTATVAFYAVAGSKSDYDWKLTADGKADLYLKNAANDSLNYLAKATVYTNIGDKCGQIDGNSKSTYYKATWVENDETVTAYYVKSDNGTVNLLVDGALVKVNPSTLALVPHDWKAASYDKDDNVATYKCKNCGTVATVFKTKEAAEASSAATVVKTADENLPAGKWLAYTDGTTTTPSTDTNKSPKTFDAGIAMYVGMALTSVAGSAVVIGKKKEF